MCVPNKETQKYMKQKLTELMKEKELPTVNSWRLQYPMLSNE